MMRLALAVLLSIGLTACGSDPSSTTVVSPSPQAWTIGNGTVTITAEARFGGSVTSVRDAHGHEYDDIVDHGREWQIAYQLDGLDEGENPTEAGSAADAAGPTSTSTILSVSVPSPNVLSTTVRPAYWYPYQGALLSPDTVSKTVTVGYAGLANVIRWDVAIDIATDHSMGVVEGLAGYGPQLPLLYVEQVDGTFTETPQADKGTVTPATSFIAASADGSQAMGVVAEKPPMLTWNQLDFLGSGVNAWGCAGWIQTPLPAGRYTATCYVTIGTLAEVEASLKALTGQ